MPFPAAGPVNRPVGEVLVCLQDASGDTITMKGFVVNVGYMTAFSALAGSAMGGPSIDWGIIKRAIRALRYVSGWGLVDGMDATFGWDRD
jgi:hypothetical protein